jgi:hypothetical protein
MVKRKHGAALAIGAALLIYGALSVFRTEDVVDCENPPIGKGWQCAALYCQKAFRDRQLARGGAQISTLKVSHNFSDAPDRSVYYATWLHEDKSVIARCELNGAKVVSIDFLDKLP